MRSAGQPKLCEQLGDSSLGLRVVPADEEVVLAGDDARIDHDVRVHRVQCLDDLRLRELALDLLAEAAAFGHADERRAALGEIECVGDVDEHFPGEVLPACGAQRFERCIAVRAVEDELTVCGGLRERHCVLACRAGADQHLVTELSQLPGDRPSDDSGSEDADAHRGECRFNGMKRVRFAPSPTGSLHVGNALSAVANRDFGDWFLLRIDDTDAARNVPGGEEEILRDLEWLGIDWDEGPIRQSERQGLYREAAEKLGGDRFGKITLLREDGTATYHLASVVDDIEFEITHVIRGNDHRPNESLHRELTAALGGTPPEYVHHGLILGEDGRKLSKREFGSTVASLRDAGIPAEAVRRYLDELGIPKHDVHYDIPRIRRLAIEAIAGMSDEDLAAAADAPVELVPALRGARDLNEAREYARQVLEPEPVSLGEEARPTLERFKELSANGGGAKDIVRELKAVGGDLRALRLALTGRERGPELSAIVAALPREETLRRIDAAL